MRKNLQSDLARGFPYVVTKQKRIVDCAVLKKIPGAKLHTSGKAPDLASSGLNIFIQNGPISNLTLWIEKICKVNGPRYVIDETGIDYNVDLDIVLYEPADVNPSMVIAELKKIGLELSIEKREKEIWVISDRRADK